MRRILLLLATMLAAVLLASGVALAKPIQIRDATTASPYPSEITISGFPATSTITDVNLELSAFTHTFPADVDMLLVHEGRNAIVLSDPLGGVLSPSSAVRRVNLVLDDQASTSLSCDVSSPIITSGTYQPTNCDGADDTFPSPAPTPSGGSALSVFNNTSPNGVWQLYIVDNSAQDKGRLGGWSLDITATPPG